MTYGTLRQWARILPFFVIEWYINKYSQDTGTLSNYGWSTPVSFEQVYDGVFLCSSRKLKLEQCKQDLERELENISEELKIGDKK